MAVRVIAALIVFVAASLGLGAAQLPIRFYTTDDGLASNRINCIVQDSRGFLWFCTREGISRFDGYQFTNYGQDQGLPGRDFDLLETRSHEYWVATGDGVAHFLAAGSGAGFRLYRPRDPRAREITSLAEDGARGIWCGTAAGLYHLEQVRGEWSLQFVDIGMPTKEWEDAYIETLLHDREGKLWIGAHRALYCRFPDGRYRRYAIGNSPEWNHILSLLEDRQGRLWVGTWDGLVRMSSSAGSSDPFVESVYTVKNGLSGSPVQALLQSADGQIWIGTAGGLSKYVSDRAREKFENFGVANGLAHSEVRAVAEDRNGNLWVGADGAHKISRGGFVTYGRQDGLASDYIASIFEDSAGQLCVTSRTSQGRFVSGFDGRRFHPVLPNIPRQIKGWGSGHNQVTFQDHTGKWWVPTDEGLFRFPTLPLTRLGSASPEALYDARTGLPGTVFVLFEDSRGDVWIATAEPAFEIYRWVRSTGTLVRYSAADGLPKRELAAAFEEDRGGDIWTGFNSVLARYRRGHFQVYEPPKPIEDCFLRTLHLDKTGRLWGACREGLVRIDSPESENPQFTVYTTAQGLSSNDVQCITEDKWGRLYVGTGRGVDCFYPRLPLYVKHYTRADGLLLADEMEAFRDRHGALWFGTPVGLSRLEPLPEDARVPPPIYISGLRIGGMPRHVSALGETELSGIELAPNQNQVEIEFLGLGFGTGEELRNQYRLEGADRDWSKPTKDRRIDFASLSSGNYRFLVRAITTDGLVSENPASVEFTILPAIWQRWWVQVMILMFAGAILYALYRYRVSRLLEFERLRTRIATDLHDDVGSTLTQIAILSEVAKRDARKEQQVESLSEIADLSRESVDAMSDIVWAIDPERDSLADLWRRMRRFATDLFSGNGIQLRFQGPKEAQDPEIETDLRRQIFLIFKEALHNTARHAACTEVEIDFRLEKGSLALTLHDNGKGFDPPVAGRGHGLASMEQRATAIGGEIRIESAPGRGTTVQLQTPLSPHRIPVAKRRS